MRYLLRARKARRQSHDQHCCGLAYVLYYYPTPLSSGAAVDALIIVIVMLLLLCNLRVQCYVRLLTFMWLVVNILLRYCLFLRSAPHRSGGKTAVCTIMVLPMLCCGATSLRR